MIAREEGLFIDFIAQRANGAFDDTVIKHEASLREFCSHLAGDLKVVAVQILSVGGIENREVRSREVECLFGNFNRGIACRQTVSPLFVNRVYRTLLMAASMELQRKRESFNQSLRESIR